jgi:hypothetical protein
VSRREALSTVIGFENINNQKNLGRLNEPGTDNCQYFYQMACMLCRHKYKANGYIGICI